jgi:multiple sugar transport system permease protein
MSGRAGVGRGTRAALGLLALAWLAPYAVMLTVSVLDLSAVGTGPVGDWLTLRHYERVLAAPLVGRSLLNGVLVCALILLLQLACCIPCGYALARGRFRGRGLATALVLAAVPIPIHVTALPLYVGFVELGLIDTYAALVLPFAASALGILMFRQAIAGLPEELFEAARLDGLGEASILLRIVLPCIRPTVAAFSVLSVVAHWNDLFWPFLVVESAELAPPALAALFARNAESGTDFGALMASAALVSTPVIAAFLVGQRLFVNAFAFSGVKG